MQPPPVPVRWGFVVFTPVVGASRYDPRHSTPLGGTMRHRPVVCLLAAMLALAGCSGDDHKPDPAACRKAIKAQYVPGTAKLKGEPERPKECDGLSTDQVSSIAESVIEELSK
jgi:hypothetical protein